MSAVPVLIVMGVSGAGKSTVARAIAARLGWAFQEGDALHPAANVAKMQAGIALDDADRAPWLHAIRAWIDARLASGQPGVVSCSALRRAYREELIAGRSSVRLLFLTADPAILRRRLEQRKGHFMPSSLLDSQLATLEPPAAEERPLTVRVDGTVEDTLAQALAAVRGEFPP